MYEPAEIDNLVVLIIMLLMDEVDEVEWALVPLDVPELKRELVREVLLDVIPHLQHDELNEVLVENDVRPDEEGEVDDMCLLLIIALFDVLEDFVLVPLQQLVQVIDEYDDVEGQIPYLERLFFIEVDEAEDDVVALLDIVDDEHEVVIDRYDELLQGVEADEDELDVLAVVQYVVHDETEQNEYLSLGIHLPADTILHEVLNMLAQ